MDVKLYNAARSGNIEILEEILRENAAALEQVTPQKNTALHLAARAGKAKFVKQLLLISSSRNRDIAFETNDSGNTALHEAAQIGNLEVVEILMLHNINLLKVKNKLDETALFKACQDGQDHHGHRVKIVEEILRSDPSILWVTAKGNRTCLHIAAFKGDLGIVDALLAGQRDQAIKLVEIEDNYGNTAMHLAVWGDHFGVVKKLLKLEPQLCYSLNKDHESPLHIAVKLGFLEIVKEIVKDKPDSIEVLSKHGKNVLHLATEIPQMDVVTYLVNEVGVSQLINQHDNLPEQNPQGNCKKKDEKHKGAREDTQQNSRGNCRKDEETKGLRDDTEQNSQGKCSKDEEDKGARDKTENEANAEEKTTDDKRCQKGDTPLHIAVRNKNAQIVQSLLKVPGVNKNAMDKNGLTPLDIARENTEYYESYIILEMLGNYPPGKKPFLYSTPNVTDPKHKKCNELVENSFKQRANSELVVAVLLATVSFTAAFTVPGGFYTEDQKDGTPAGTPILIHRLSFKIFIVFDTVAFFLSLFAVLMWQLSSPISTGNMMFFMSWTSFLVCSGFSFIAHSFTAAVYVVVVRKVKALAWTLLGVGILTSVCGHLVFYYVAIIIMVKRARIQHLLGAHDIVDCWVNYLWTCAEKQGCLDCLRCFEGKVRRILSGQPSSGQCFPVDESDNAGLSHVRKTTTLGERDSNPESAV
eukprot:Gb_26481 [translate_table: standard]